MAKPFLKWAGGKRQLIDKLVQGLPVFKSYYEPFIGGGALFFHIASTRQATFHISDLNKNLIGVYQSLKANCDAVVAALKDLTAKGITAESYYAVRDQYNDLKEFHPDDPLTTACFIYLNRTCFNGLYRENSKGRFNVPFGKYKNPEIINEDNLSSVATCLQPIDISCLGWEQAISTATESDLVYFDPPYDKLSETSFTSYLKFDFGREDQKKLRDACVDLTNKGVRFMLSNANTAFIRDLYADFKIEEVYANRSINSKGSDRSKQPIEVIVRNFEVL